MNTNNIKEIGKWLMITGAGVFTCGLGINLTCNYIDKKESKKLHSDEMFKIEEADAIAKNALEEEAIKARAEKDKIYSEKLKSMDNKSFAKFHADNVAKANDDVIRNADQVKKIAESEVIDIKMSCADQIRKIKEDCLAKVEAANKERDTAVSNYDTINSLFTNKKEILNAKAYLEKAVKDREKSEQSKEEVLNDIKNLLG